MRKRIDCYLLYTVFVVLLLLGAVSRSNARSRSNRRKYPKKFLEHLGLYHEHLKSLATIDEFFLRFHRKCM